MLLNISIIIFLWVALALSLFSVVFVLLVLRYKSNIYKRKIDNQDKQIKRYASENNSFKTKLDELVQERTKDFHDQMELNQKLIIDRKIALKKANDANFLKNAFLSNMSHEIRTPLNSILGFSELLHLELSSLEDESLTEYTAGITESSQRLMHLLNNLIDISRVDANDYEVNPQTSNVNKAIQHVFELFQLKAQEKNVGLHLLPTDIPDSVFDSSILERILSLILDNALKYTDHGKINISSLLKSKENKILILIKDTGIGIDEKFQDEIFAPFRQESFGYSKTHQGAGLGLPLAKKLSRLIQGEIQIKSKKKEGTIVSIYIPFIQNNAGQTNREINSNTENSIAAPSFFNPDKKLDILVVEDDKMNRIVYKKMLGQLCNLSICEDGDITLEYIEYWLKNNKSIDLVLMDINLPPPWDGIILMKEIKQKYPQAKHIPFIAQTAYAMSGDREKMLREGFDDYIAKPIDKAELFHVIEQNLKKDHYE